ncbi:MAG TPA: hypothetical protein VFK05_25925, partial [Polyangiaceae bacterium]|nr:hypothetical protein [Polyangiaceae bacterium]
PRADGPATQSEARVSGAAQRSPLSLVPARSAFVLSVDARALVRAPLGAFIAERLERSAGASTLSQSCGFDPLLRLEQLALTIPSATLSADAQPDFGIIANGRFSSAEIIRCASTAIGARGGDAIRTKLGSFDTVRDGSANGGEIAARDGLVIVSGGSYFRELVDLAEGVRGPATQQDTRNLAHAELRRALGPGALLVTWLLGEGWFERIAGAESDARLSPLSGLTAIAARLNVAETAQLRVLLDSADSAGASQIASLLGDLQSSFAAPVLGPRLLSIAKRIAVERSEARLTLELELTQAELSDVLDALAP